MMNPARSTRGSRRGAIARWRLSTIRCGGCRELGHDKVHCPIWGDDTRRRMGRIRQCSRCGGLGHYAIGCQATIDVEPAGTVVPHFPRAVATGHLPPRCHRCGGPWRAEGLTTGSPWAALACVLCGTRVYPADSLWGEVRR